MSDPPFVAAANLLANGRALAARVEARGPGPRVEIDTPRTRQWARAAERLKAIEHMSLDGKSVAEIAEALGVSYGYVVQLRGRLGVGRLR